MKMSVYAIATQNEVRENCLAAIGGLRGKWAFEKSRHDLIENQLQARIRECQATIDHIDKEFVQIIDTRGIM